MRILHTSDWHIGRTLHGVSLHDAHEAWFDHLVEVVRSESVDAVVVSGDVYDRAVPPLDSVELLSDTLGRLCARTRVIMTPGNHDSATRLGFGSSLYADALVVRSCVAGVATPVALGDDAALVYALPYLDPEMTRGDLADGDDPLPRSHEAVISAAMTRVNADLARRRRAAGRRIPAVVMAHAFVTGAAESESERDIRVGGVGAVPAGVFGSGVDYLALGHLHGPQQVRARCLARYAGSPVAFSFSERDHRKSAVLVDLAAGHAPAVEVVPAPVLRSLSQVRGTLAEVLSGGFDHLAGTWCKFEITDPHRPERMRERLLERFPHALVTLHTPEADQRPLGSRRVTPASDPMEVLGSFVQDVTGSDPSDAETVVLRGAYEAAEALGRSA